VIVDDFDIGRTSSRPNEANTPLLVDPDAVLADSIASQGFEMVVRRHGEVTQYAGVVQNSQFSQSRSLNVLRQSVTKLAVPETLSLG
jgi:hypothetical protein